MVVVWFMSGVLVACGLIYLWYKWAEHEAFKQFWGP